MTRIFLDTNIPLYAAGGDHAYRDPCRALLLAIASREVDAVTDAEVLQEILHRYLRVAERDKGFRVFDEFHRVMAGRILPVTDADLLAARNLAVKYTFLSPRDLIHLAVAYRAHVPDIVTTDRGFDRVTEVRRVDPTTFST